MKHTFMSHPRQYFRFCYWKKLKLTSSYLQRHSPVTNECKLVPNFLEFSRTQQNTAYFNLNDEQLEEAWLFWQLQKICQDQNCAKEMKLTTELDDSNSASHRKNVESLCHRVMLKLYQVPNKWLKHTCEVQECLQGYVTIDGNEKIHRPKWAAPNEYIASDPSIPNIINCCTETPIFGNNNLKTQKYCEKHCFLESRESEDKLPAIKLRKTDDGKFEVVQPIPKIVIRLPEFEGMDPEIIKSINTDDPAVNDTTKSCKKKKMKAKKFYKKKQPEL